MGPTLVPSQAHFESTSLFARESEIVCICILERKFLFQQNTPCSSGTKVVIHLKPDQRASWSYHGEEGWYVGPSMEHYRCVKYYIPTTARERDVDTLQFFPKKIPFPSISTEDDLKQDASDILAILQKRPSSLPYLAYS
jgi:hypothetical protein